MSRRVLQERRHPLEDAASMHGVAKIKIFAISQDASLL
jgi:hypothetical protein